MAKNITDKKFMMLALKEALKNVVDCANGGPFGACIVKDGKIIAAARNTVLIKDATCHAEINAIRKASKKLGTYDLSGCEIFSTTEPCPMCFSAIHWARISRIVYGADISDAHMAGFNELKISNRDLKRLGRSKVKIKSGVLRDECVRLFHVWKNCPDSKTY